MDERRFLRISLLGDDLLRILIELDAFRICPPLETDDFIKLCTGSGLNVTAALLEQFEKKSLFYPLLRVKFPIHSEKHRLLDDGRIEDCGTLSEGEEWQGQIHERYVWPNFSHHDLRRWMDEGLLYSPEARAFEAWDSFRDARRRKAIASYYSPFQLFTLRFQLNRTGILLNSAWIVDYSDEDFEKLKVNLRERAAWYADPESRLDNPQFDAVILAQTIASRYYPKASGDRRTITVPGNWDWYGYVRAWRAEEIVARLGISKSEVQRCYEILNLELSFMDPLAAWDDLLSFVRLSERVKLKGDAQCGQVLRAMRSMFGLLFEDLGGEPLESREGSLAERYALDESSKFSRSAEIRSPRFGHEVDLLELVVNRYGLNPRPELVLFVEGDGEEVAIPQLIEKLYGLSLPVAGVQIRNLSGVAGFTGSKKERYGALEKVIEELHWVQTVVFVVLDNEARGVHDIRRKLASKASKYFPKRTVIRREFIHIWDKSIELDNFSPEEIAAALTLAAGERHRFTEEEVIEASATFGQRADPISHLFKTKTEYGLPKREFLCHLVDQPQLDDPSVSARPLVVLLGQILEIAALNHKPTFVDIWFENQEYLGHPTSGEEDKMAKSFAKLQGIQGHLEAHPVRSGESIE